MITLFVQNLVWALCLLVPAQSPLGEPVETRYALFHYHPSGMPYLVVGSYEPTSGRFAPWDGVTLPAWTDVERPRLPQEVVGDAMLPAKGYRLAPAVTAPLAFGIHRGDDEATLTRFGFFDDTNSVFLSIWAMPDTPLSEADLKMLASYGRIVDDAEVKHVLGVRCPPDQTQHLLEALDSLSAVEKGEAEVPIFNVGARVEYTEPGVYRTAE